MSGFKSSIHFSVVKENSENHNQRKSDLDYVFSDDTKNNTSWISSTIAEKQKEIEKYCKQLSGRKLQKNAQPIREAVVNLYAGHTLADLHKLSEELKGSFGMDCFQIYIHKDEGLKDKEGFKINYHAHMLFRFQDMKTGKTLRLNKTDLSKIQSLVAESLGMERGELKENTNRERLEPIEYKRKQEELKFNTLQEQNKVLEQKKNNVKNRIKELRERFKEMGGEDERETREFLKSFPIGSEKDFESYLKSLEVNQAEKAINHLKNYNKRIFKAIQDSRNEYQKLERDFINSRK